MKRSDLPDGLEPTFSTGIARLHGVSRTRLRAGDLTAPFHGVRTRVDVDAPDAAAPPDAETDPYERQRAARVAHARIYNARLHTGHFFSHQTAASIWGGPLPLEFDERGKVAADHDLDLHVSALGGIPFPRAAGIIGHRTLASLTSLRVAGDLRVSSPATTWVSLGTLPLFDLIALGDYFCRCWRVGHGRPDAGRPPLATIEHLRQALEAGRRRGAKRLRTALEAVREDSWSPRETRVRCLLVGAGLPEPALNVDVYAPSGRFIGCVDMAYADQKVAIEYLGMLHSHRWAQDVERLAALRAAGWTVIEVSAPLLQRPAELVSRVRRALAA
ncbi:hypothetical protein [Microbacterium sp. SA39]|uniref:hypothetical protein n=1 Tax=Microbacterium sp. SA39 TaxID=1263625 RepID=UPI00061FB8C5|nr:hypothetical protein [Microbacterium sp. SA39]KJQ55138.1 hypothetical protein RS85_00912 [Microbacterium sp. SA39]